MMHSCDLVPPDDIVVKLIQGKCCVRLRRSFRRCLLVNGSNPRAKVYFKSQTAIFHECARHLESHYYVIHPFSKYRQLWDVIMVLVSFLALIIIPIHLAIDYLDLRYLIVAFDLFALADVATNFCTGFCRPHTKRVILNWREIAINYLTGSFICDFVTSLPLNLVPRGGEVRIVMINSFTILKIYRIVVFFRYLQRFHDWQDLNSTYTRILKIAAVYFFLLFWSTSIIMLITYYYDEISWVDEFPKEYSLNQWLIFSQCFYRATYMFMLVEFGDDESQVPLDIIVRIIGLNIGLMLQLLLLAEILQLLNRNNSASIKFHQLMGQVKEYMRFKELPEDIKRRIISYYHYRFQKHFYKETFMMNLFSKELKQEIALHLCRDLVERVDFLSDLPASLLNDMVDSMKLEFYMPNDVIIQSGQIGNSMYFISAGTVAVYASNGKEIYHLEDGANFGETSLLLPNVPRVTNVIAVSQCEVYSLSLKDFQKAIQCYPQLLIRLQKLSEIRLQRSITIMGESNSNIVHPGDKNNENTKRKKMLSFKNIVSKLSFTKSNTSKE